EEVALELEHRPHAAAGVDLEQVVRGEQRPELPVLQALRADRVRELAGSAAGGRVRPAGVLARVEDAEADAVVLEVRLRDAVHAALEDAVGSARELAPP